MNNDVRKNVEGLYAAEPAARTFLDRAASRLRDASATSIDRMMALCGLNRAEAVKLAKRFEELGCADFIVGRHGAPSRLKWHFSLISLGKVASDELSELEAVGRDAEPDDGPAVREAERASDEAEVGSVLSLNEAKEKLARSLGVPVANIEITVKA